MNPRTIMYVANPIDDKAFSEAWHDPQGHATLERILATEAPMRRRVIQRRTLIGLATAATAAVVGVVIGIPGLSHQGAQQAAAWDVTRNADGTISASFTDYRDPAGLQTQLRDEGIRANVQTLPEACFPAAVTGDGTGSVGIIEWDPALSGSDLHQLALSLFPPTGQNGFRIDPQYLPANDSIWIGFPPDGAASAAKFLRIAVYPTETGPHQCFSR